MKISSKHTIHFQNNTISLTERTNVWNILTAGVILLIVVLEFSHPLIPFLIGLLIALLLIFSKKTIIIDIDNDVVVKRSYLFNFQVRNHILIVNLRKHRLRCKLYNYPGDDGGPGPKYYHLEIFYPNEEKTIELLKLDTLDQAILVRNLISQRSSVDIIIEAL